MKASSKTDENRPSRYFDAAPRPKGHGTIGAAVAALWPALKPILFVPALLWIVGLRAASASQTPTVTRVTPSHAIYGNATLTITGDGFDSTTQVLVNGVAFTTKFVS